MTTVVIFIKTYNRDLYVFLLCDIISTWKKTALQYIKDKIKNRLLAVPFQFVLSFVYCNLTT